MKTAQEKQGYLTQDRLREVFDYRDGSLFWKISPRAKVRVGDKAGCLGVLGYAQIQLCGKQYKAHRLIWLWHHGYLPENPLDHINRVRSDNRIENLREVSQSCNLRNTGNRVINKSGVKGVHFDKKIKRWVANITVSRKQIFIYCHTDFVEVVCHRLAAEQSIDWAGCDSFSPAYQYVKNHVINPIT